MKAYLIISLEEIRICLDKKMYLHKLHSGDWVLSYSFLISLTCNSSNHVCSVDSSLKINITDEKVG